ncbi:MAG: hypothetical protein H6865_07635 [Rhodospirillales bacterium]|nr:hypothetical protein [Rhodospirillales bacterium]USO07539.1 MAG: hypothetical protein H6866_09020 [Rhodospirillales bacterium]
MTAGKKRDKGNRRTAGAVTRIMTEASAAPLKLSPPDFSGDGSSLQGKILAALTRGKGPA